MLFHAYTSFAFFANTLASYHIDFDPVGLENTPSFDDANFPLRLSPKPSTVNTPCIGFHIVILTLCQ
jgi:hypothetical protein